MNSRLGVYRQRFNGGRRSVFYKHKILREDPVQAIAMLLGGLVMVAGGEIAVTGSSTSFFKAQQISDFRMRVRRRDRASHRSSR